MRQVIPALASHKLTVAFFILMAAGALWAAHGGNATLATMMPLTLLTLNLAAAIVSKARFRADLPLLVFHLALLAFVVLLAIARLTYFDGATILTANTPFEGNLVKDKRGPAHGDGVSTLRFANEGFTEHVEPGSRYLSTYNQVRWWDESGQDYLAEIGDDRPLVLDGYRIYATPRRGYSPVFLWQPISGDDDYGTIQLPDFMSADLGSAVSWQLPAGPQAWILLGKEQQLPPIDNKRADLGSKSLPHHLILRVGEQRMEMRVGDTLALDGGQLTYVRLDSWIGYRIVKDLTEPWLMAVVLIGVASLLWFYTRILFKSDGGDLTKEGK